MPEAVREAIGLIAGSPVIDARNIEGGFSPVWLLDACCQMAEWSRQGRGH